MRFSRLIIPTILALSSAPLAGIVSLPGAVAQDVPGAAPDGELPPGVTMPPQTPPQPLPPLQEQPEAKTQAENKSPERRIDDLLAQLRRESDPDKAKGLAQQIQSDWSDSGSATINLLLQWAAEAVDKKNNGAALDFLDRATLLDPDFTGAWHQRATLHYTMGDRRKAMADINEVLRREPRHFGAIAGMAAILMESEEDALAEKALEQYLAIYPADREAREQMAKLAEKLAGSRT